MLQDLHPGISFSKTFFRGNEGIFRYIFTEKSKAFRQQKGKKKANEYARSKE
jgi:hypothetical protein